MGECSKRLQPGAAGAVREMGRRESVQLTMRSAKREARSPCVAALTQRARSCTTTFAQRPLHNDSHKQGQERGQFGGKP